MACVPSKNSRPELAVRSFLFSLGFRYRLHSKELPGRPDIVFRSRKKVVFVNGCFWHRHANCKLARLPKSRTEFWVTKLEGNKRRDGRNKRHLNRLGWKTLTIWECQIGRESRLFAKLLAFLDQS